MDPREDETTDEAPIGGEGTLTELLARSVAAHADSAAQRYKGGVADRSLVAADALPAAPPGEYAAVTYGELDELVGTLTTGFRDLGVDPGDRVAIYASTRMEWAQTDFALLGAGGVVTTIYASATERYVRHVLEDADVSLVVVEDERLRSRLREATAGSDLDPRVVTIDETPEATTLGDVHARGVAADSAGAATANASEHAVPVERAPDDLASILYTSGTTGTPKGVPLTHRNLVSNVDQCYRRLGPRPGRDRPAVHPSSRTVSLLPLAHVFERTVGHFLMFAAGAAVGYAESPETLREDLQLLEPTVFTSVPRVYERLYEAAQASAGESRLGERLFEWAGDVARTRGRTDDPGPSLSVRHRVADRLVLAKVRAALGGEVEYLISGGDRLSPELCAFYHGLDAPILEGYGLTETSPVVSVNPPESPAVGTIGPPVSGVEIRIDGDAVDDDLRRGADGEVGELLVSGPNVVSAYWNAPEATAEAIEDGYLRTGDVVERRADGHLVFRERTKQILTLSTGRNVAPGPIEAAVESTPLVEQCMLVGDGRKCVAALVVVDLDRVRSWGDRDGHDLPADPSALCEDERVRRRVGDAVERATREFEPHERIELIHLLPEAFTESNGLLTPTLKKRRRDIRDRYAEEIEELYREG